MGVWAPRSRARHQTEREQEKNGSKCKQEEEADGLRIQQNLIKQNVAFVMFFYYVGFGFAFFT